MYGRSEGSLARLSPNTSSSLLGTEVPFPEAMAVLLQAHDYANDVGRNIWDFAVEIRRLYDLSLSECDLRWLLCKGYVLQASEIRVPRQGKRHFGPRGGLVLTNESCFVLTAKGVEFAKFYELDFSSPMPGEEIDVASEHIKGPSEVVMPDWDPSLRELSVGDKAVKRFVKRFRVPAPNQELVLHAFKEENWKEQIDDPLPPAREIDPKRRLQATIMCLNRNQIEPLIRFRGNGKGNGVRWEMSHQQAKRGHS